MSLSVEKFRKIDQRGAESYVGNSEEPLARSMEDDFSFAGETVVTKSSAGSFSFENVRFTPKVIEFVDAFQGKQFAVKINIQNMGRNPVLIKVGEPSSFIFQLKKPIRRAKFLASGTSITRTITYNYHDDDMVQRSQIPMQINGHPVFYPIIVRKASPTIEVQPQKLDFKIINLGASATTLILSIINRGGKRTKFEIDVGKNDLDMVVKPLRGTIKAKDEVNVIVELMGTTEGEFYKELWVTTTQAPIRVPILVEVVRPRLEIIHPNSTDDFSLINFRPTFNGTQRARSFVVKNYSAETSLFIILAEVNGELQFLKDARKNHQSLDPFFLTAEEGRLEPFECRVITVVFRPKAPMRKSGWHHDENDKRKWEHMVFLGIKRVHCIERKEYAERELMSLGMTKKDSLRSSMVRSMTNFGLNRGVSTKGHRPSDFLLQILESSSTGGINTFLSDNSTDEWALKLCLHGKSIDPVILIQPTNFLLGVIKLRERTDRSLRITNNSVIAVKYKFGKTINVKVTPVEGWLKPEQAQEFLVSITPTCAGIFKTKVKINILASSDVVFDRDKNMETITTISVPLSYHVQQVVKHPRPKIGQGIAAWKGSPWVTFKEASKLPYSAVLLSLTKSMKPDWMKKERDQVKNVDNALVALPNDRVRAFYSWPKENVCRTIFRGIFRYSPPEDVTYTFIMEELAEKKQRLASWKEFINALKEKRARHLINLEKLKHCYSEYKLSCPKHYNMEQYKPKLLPPSSNDHDIKKFFQKREAQFQEVLVPLSPEFLSAVDVGPKFIDFHSVAANTLVQETLVIKNMNPFSISILFIPGNSAVTIPEGDIITIRSLATKRLRISFQMKDLGRYYGYLNYVINGCHEFKITISAFITPKTLHLNFAMQLSEEENTIEFGNYPEKYAFQPMSEFVSLENCLQSPISYVWTCPQDAPFLVSVKEGIAPSRSKILSEFSLDVCPKKPAYGEVTLTSESGESEILKLTYRPKKISVSFLTNYINLGDISMNLQTTAKPIIQNASYQDVAFHVVDSSPMPGVTVEPQQGIIKARSFFPLEVKIQIPVVMTFSFEVTVIIQTSSNISVKITGNVVIPIIRLKPSKIVMKKICAQSFDTVSVCVENAGTTPAELDIDFTECPEYKLVGGGHPIFIPPKKSTKLMIHFEPKDVASYFFYLPIILNKILGPPSIDVQRTEFVSSYIYKLQEQYTNHGEVFDTDNLKVLCVTVSSTVSPSLLKISPLHVHFTMNNSFEFQPQIIVFSNDYINEVTFCIRNDDLGKENDSPFDLIPTEPDSVEYRSKSIKATLKQRQQLSLKATFQPKAPGLYEVEIPIFVRGYNNGYVYNYITMKGELKKPRIYPEKTEIHFPPVPLAVGCDGILIINAENYVLPDTVSCVIWDPLEGYSSGSDYLTITWLTEPTIRPCKKGKQTLQLQITFHSALPIALKCHLLFLDSKGGYCSVGVTAIADNSTITTHSFLNVRSSMYKLMRGGPPELKWVADEVVLSCPVNKNSPSFLKTKKDSSKSNGAPETVNNLQAAQGCLDRGPQLVIQRTRGSNMGFVNRTNISFEEVQGVASSSDIKENPSRSVQSILNEPEVKVAKSSQLQVRSNQTAYPHFPLCNACGKNIQETLVFVERWMYEVVMRCDQYFRIPGSFQRLNIPEKFGKDKMPKVQLGKDFLDFLEEIVESEKKALLPNRPSLKNTSPVRNVDRIYFFFADVLRFLQDQGCLLPHVRAEHLLEYDVYLLYNESRKSTETIGWKIEETESTGGQKNLKENVAPKEKHEEEENPTSSSLSTQTSWKKYLDVTDSSMYIDRGRTEEDMLKTPFPKELDPIRHLIEGKQFVHEVEVLDRAAFDERSSQGWLDIVLQCFRNFALKRIVYKSTIPQVTVFEVDERLSVETIEVRSLSRPVDKENLQPLGTADGSNLYTVEERILLSWLNHHLHVQKQMLWSSYSSDAFNEKIINNFDKDLADSIALISVTASHCPYIVSGFFQDVFLKADAPNKLYHNAGKLILAWREINIGMTLRASDIVEPNPVFMVMLVAHLYEVLPSLHPHSFICFAAPLTSESTRVIQLKNESDERLFYEGKFVGDNDHLFRLNRPSLIEVPPHKTVDVSVTFSAKMIQKVFATLFLNGHVISSSFGKHLAFFLEGNPSQLLESATFSFTAPLYEVVCTEIQVKPPFPEPATYEIWYTTEAPQYSEDIDICAFIKPWSRISNRKVPRRLFLNKSEITKEEGSDNPMTVGLTVACFTEQERSFWLLFRSKVGNFIVLIQTQAIPPLNLPTISCYLSEKWSSSTECLCADTEGLSPSILTCPLVTELKIPKRNEALWSALEKMFFKTLHSREKPFWTEHFELNIGICLIVWLLSPDEEKEVVDEFLQVLPTKVSYSLRVEPPNDKYVLLPPKLEIADVRERSNIAVPIHISSEAPSSLEMILTMTSETEMEVRRLQVFIQPPPLPGQSTPDLSQGLIPRFLCRPPNREASDTCKRKREEKNKNKKTERKRTIEMLPCTFFSEGR